MSQDVLAGDIVDRDRDYQFERSGPVDSYCAQSLDGGDLVRSRTVYGYEEGRNVVLGGANVATDPGEETIVLRPGMRVIVAEPGMEKVTVIDIHATPSGRKRGVLLVREIHGLGHSNHVLNWGAQTFKANESMTVPVPADGMVKAVDRQPIETVNVSDQEFNPTDAEFWLAARVRAVIGAQE